MLNPKHILLIVLFSWLIATRVNAQDSLPSSIEINVPDKAIVLIGEKAMALDEKLEKSIVKYLSKLQRQEKKLKDRVSKKDSSLAKHLFEGIEEKYEMIKQAPLHLSKYSQVYSGHLDSLTTAVKFLKGERLENPELNKALSQFAALQNRLDQTEKIRSFLSERKRLLQENLDRLGMLKSLKGFQKQAYYYSQQVKACKEMWEDPSKLERKLLEALSQTEAFQDFFRNNSQLGSLFAPPGGNAITSSLSGLQTRASVQQSITDRFGSGFQAMEVLQANLQAAQEQLSEYKSKLSQYSTGDLGNSNSDIDIPEGFKPNSQKKKPFLERLEYGANLQSQKARSHFPIATDLGLSLGYKLNDNNSIGFGASYKLGWGRGWDHIRITSEGIGLRSYLDVKLKGSIYISGGYEQNYRAVFQNLQQLKDLNAWQQSGLLGLSKRYQVSKKVKGDMKLLWDFLSYRQVPSTQAILFRVGYNLK